MDNTTSNNSEKKNTAAIILGFLLAVSAGVNIYQWQNHGTVVTQYESRIDTIQVKADNLEKEMEENTVELDKYKGINSHLDSVVNEGNAKIAEQQTKIKTLMSKSNRSAEDNKKLKEEIALLRKLKDDYLERIDDLMVENQKLKDENKTLGNTVTNLNEDKKGLQQKVNTAAVLKVEYVKVNSFKKKNSGKYTETTMAKRTNKIEVCATVLANAVAQPGDRYVQLRILEPTTKKVLSGANWGTFTDPETNTEVTYTAAKKISYTQDKQDVCVEYQNDERILNDGEYEVELYIDGKLASSGTYKLR